MARRKRLILTEFVVTVWEDRVDWGGVESLVWRLLHAKPASGFCPSYGRSAVAGISGQPIEDNPAAAAHRGGRILPRKPRSSKSSRIAGRIQARTCKRVANWAKILASPTKKGLD